MKTKPSKTTTGHNTYWIF